MKLVAGLILLLSLRSEANVCTQDVKKYCTGIEPGKGQLAKCLSENETALTPECANELKEFRKKAGGINPCFEDLAEFCGDVPTFGRRLDYCLLRHESQLSVKCHADFKKKKNQLLNQDSCAQDISNICYKAVTEPEGAILRCLIKNTSKLSKTCNKSIVKKTMTLKQSNPCFDDTEKYCPGVSRFVDIHLCMSKNINALRSECRKEVKKEIEKEKMSPCYMDVRRHCKNNITASEEHDCLELNKNELSSACSQFRDLEKVKIQQMVKFCEQDRIKTCPNAPVKNGLVLKCLKENINFISTGCKNLIK
jgi:hypothetical protein